MLMFYLIIFILFCAFINSATDEEFLDMQEKSEKNKIIDLSSKGSRLSKNDVSDVYKGY